MIDSEEGCHNWLCPEYRVQAWCSYHGHDLQNIHKKKGKISLHIFTFFFNPMTSNQFSKLQIYIRSWLTCESYTLEELWYKSRLKHQNEWNMEVIRRKTNTPKMHVIYLIMPTRREAQRQSWQTHPVIGTSRLGRFSELKLNWTRRLKN